MNRFQTIQFFLYSFALLIPKSKLQGYAKLKRDMQATERFHNISSPLKDSCLIAFGSCMQKKQWEWK